MIKLMHYLFIALCTEYHIWCLPGLLQVSVASFCYLCVCAFACACVCVCVRVCVCMEDCG